MYGHICVYICVYIAIYGHIYGYICLYIVFWMSGLVLLGVWTCIWMSGFVLGRLDLFFGCLDLFLDVWTCQSEGSALNGIFGPCACLLAGGCGAWRLLARRRRRRRRHSVPIPLWGPKIDKNRQNPLNTCSKNPGACFF